MKFHRAIATVLSVSLGLAGLAALPAHAQTAEGTFDVVINLTSKCEINNVNAATGAVVNDVVFNYTSFQTVAATATGGGFNVRCTDDLPFTLALDSAGETDDAVDLAYTLTLSATTGSGTGVNQAFTVNGSMAAGQAGRCLAGGVCTNTASTNNGRTLTIGY